MQCSKQQLCSITSSLRAMKRPDLNNTDRFVFVWLYRLFPSVLRNLFGRATDFKGLRARYSHPNFKTMLRTVKRTERAAAINSSNLG
jgi:hypothetical protein